MNTTPKTLADLMDQDLAGYKLATVYYLELKHNLWGFFPAIIASNDEPIICLDKALLEKVWRMLPRSRCKISENLVLTNEETGIAFSITMYSEHGLKLQPLHLFTQKEFDENINKEDEPFRWSPGLLGALDAHAPSPFA